MAGKASRTINPLHFEDLEPHRFEDLVRQLAYGFRQWSRIEGTGRLGQDEGIDIRALEVITATALPAGDSEEVEEGPGQSGVGEREWRIRCKRYKTIGPKLMRQIVTETVPDSASAPYGLIVAAACDVSAQAMAAFHDERHKRGVAEGHLWTKAHLEDLLFLPENDHLLFVYFGLSLGTRRRSQLQQLQGQITLKRKLLRAFKKDSISDLHTVQALIRDVSDSYYPRKADVARYASQFVPPWFVGTILQPYSKGIVISRFTYDGWLRPDSTWDFLPETASESRMEGWNWDQDHATEESQRHWERQQYLWRFRGNVPEQERAKIGLAWLLPLISILEVDPIGDIVYSGPHLLCRYENIGGPSEIEEPLLLSNSRPQGGVQGGGRRL